MPCDYADYPSNWQQIRERIRDRSGDKCEWCGILNGQYRVGASGTGLVKTVLTVAHLDHDLSNNDGMESGGPPLYLGEANLVHLCQRCHLWHDRHQHAETRRQNRLAESGQMPLFE